LQDTKILIDAAESDPFVDCQCLAPVIERLHQGMGRDEYNTARFLVAGRPSPLMAMQATDALEQDVGRGEITDHQVGIYIEALLECLGANDDQRSTRAAWA